MHAGRSVSFDLHVVCGAFRWISRRRSRVSEHVENYLPCACKGKIERFAASRDREEVHAKRTATSNQRKVSEWKRRTFEGMAMEKNGEEDGGSRIRRSSQGAVSGG